MHLPPPKERLRKATAQNKQDVRSKALHAWVTLGNGSKGIFLWVPELCLSAPILLKLFGKVHPCNQLDKRAQMEKKKKLTELHTAFGNCSQRKNVERQSETSNALKLNKAFREFYVPVKSNPWLIMSI